MLRIKENAIIFHVWFVVDKMVLRQVYNGSCILLHTWIHNSVFCWRKSVSIRHNVFLFSDWSFVGKENNCWDEYISPSPYFNTYAPSVLLFVVVTDLRADSSVGKSLLLYQQWHTRSEATKQTIYFSAVSLLMEWRGSTVIKNGTNSTLPFLAEFV